MSEPAVVTMLEPVGSSLVQPNRVEIRPSETAEQQAVSGLWLTPGSYISIQISSRSEVLAIVERLEPDRHCVTVALEKDPEELLDSIFRTEQRMFDMFRRLPFDLRVTVPGDAPALQSILNSGLVHYKRA